MSKELKGRFESTKTYSGMGMTYGARILTDTETGVQYLFAFSGEAGGLTVLVDRDGKPLLSDDAKMRL